MAQKIQVELEDDIDHGVADETVQFGLDGISYEIDLSNKNAEALREALARYVDVARRIGGRKVTKKSTAIDDSEAAAIREWGKANGHDIPERGRISEKWRTMYREAQNGNAETSKEKPSEAPNTATEPKQATSENAAGDAAQPQS